MSGIDEQVRDFPKCINCNRYRYWIGGRNTSNGRVDDIFFNPLSFRGDNGRSVPIYDSEESRMSRVEELEGVIEIRCDACREPANIATFNKIICAAKHLIREWESENVRSR